MTGRPSSYTDAIAEEICERLANGESLPAILATADMPAQKTVYRWLEANEAFRQRYADARARQADHYADQIVTIADTADDANKARLQIDARKWVASKLLPKKYGERTTQTIEGGDKPIEVREVSQTEIARRLAAILTDATKD